MELILKEYLIMWNWKVQCLLITMCLCPCAPYIYYNFTQLRWVDDIYNIQQQDTYFDRIVMMVLNETVDAVDVYMNNHSLIAPGFLIKDDMVLTSFNPFRKIIKDKEKRNNIVIAIIDYRIVHDLGISYELDFRTIECARQVIPMYDQEFYNVWHGGKKDNSPLHDLMVIRLNRSVTFTSEKPLQEYSTNSKVKAGPLLTELAKPRDHLEGEMKYAAVGYKTHYDIWKWCCLHITSHDEDAFENIERNCDKWLPREWGYFICIDNVNDYPALGSGAMLVSNEKLYGVGSFMIKRGGQSIMVFTDVRRYYELVFMACSWFDQDLGVTTTTEVTTKK